MRYGTSRDVIEHIVSFPIVGDLKDRDRESMCPQIMVQGALVRQGAMTRVDAGVPQPKPELIEQSMSTEKVEVRDQAVATNDEDLAECGGGLGAEPLSEKFGQAGRMLAQTDLKQARTDGNLQVLISELTEQNTRLQTKLGSLEDSVSKLGRDGEGAASAEPRETNQHWDVELTRNCDRLFVPSRSRGQKQGASGEEEVGASVQGGGRAVYSPAEVEALLKERDGIVDLLLQRCGICELPHIFDSQEHSRRH